jgi:hypothetical protein
MFDNPNLHNDILPLDLGDHVPATQNQWRLSELFTKFTIITIIYSGFRYKVKTLRHFNNARYGDTPFARRWTKPKYVQRRSERRIGSDATARSSRPLLRMPRGR